MKKKLAFVFFFSFFYLLNSITPMSFGDDYVYSFIWEGHSLYEPLSENAVRISSWQNLFASQVLHYFTWSGRIVNHTLAQFFLWTGKRVFNICNSLVSVLLIAEIYSCSQKGVVTVKTNAGKLCGIFMALWFFTPKFGDVFLWLDGACNYLWTTVLLIGFLLPYIRKYYLSYEDTSKDESFSLFMFFLGFTAGCTNENTICWILPILIFFVFRLRKCGKAESWVYFGVAGLMVGYAFLMFSPGNMARLLAEKKGYSWLSWAGIRDNAALLFLILLYFQVFLWYFNLRSLYSIGGKVMGNIELAKEVSLVKIMCAVSFCMTFVMLFSPSFPPRSAFPGTILLIIAACILLRIQEEYFITLIRDSAKKLLLTVGGIYFIVTAATTFYGSYYNYNQINELISVVKSSDYAKKNVIEVNSLHPIDDMIYKASCFHIMTVEMSDNENDWRNAAFARYYGIKGIRMIKRESDNQK